MSDNTGTQALWTQMIRALAAIDDELGLPQDGCNTTQRTLDAIRLLKLAHRDDVTAIADIENKMKGLEEICAALRAAMDELEQAEAHYRLTFQIAPSAGHLDVGRAWDRMKKAGDIARAALAQSEAQSEAQPVPEPLSADDVWNSQEIMSINGARAGLAMPVLMDLVRAIERIVIERMRGKG
jgi:hypothetical protein